jgi:hypothetical protein
MVGLAQGAFNKSFAYAHDRKQFGQPVGSFQGMQMQFAEAACQIETARLLTYNAARLKETGKPFTKESAMAKYWASQVAIDVSRKAIEWAGGVGFTRETGSKSSTSACQYRADCLSIQSRNSSMVECTLLRIRFG